MASRRGPETSKSLTSLTTPILKHPIIPFCFSNLSLQPVSSNFATSNSISSHQVQESKYELISLYQVHLKNY